MMLKFSRWVGQILVRLGVDVSTTEEETSSDFRRLRQQCDRLSIAGIYVAGITTSIGAVLPWFTDFLFFAPDSPEFRGMFIVRSAIVLLTITTFAALRIVPQIAKHPYIIGIVVFSMATGVSGWIVGDAGGFDSPLAYAVYTTPLLTLVLFVELHKRILAALAILFSFFGALLLSAPDQLQHPFVGVVITWSGASAFAAVAAGHLVFMVLRTNLIQRRKLDDLTDHLQERVAEQTGEIRRLTTSVFKVQEEERLRISHDLHDELGQMLFRLNMEVEMMQHRNEQAGQASSPFNDSLDLLKQLVEQLHEALDRILGALRPVVLESLGFDIAITRMARDISSNSDLATDVLFNAEVDDFSETAKTALYRIVQEGLTNIVKHAKATRALVEFRAEGDELLLTIGDDGKGFTGDASAGKNRLGLKGIHERAKLLDGQVLMGDGLEGGTEILIRFPLKRIESGTKS